MSPSCVQNAFRKRHGLLIIVDFYLVVSINGSVDGSLSCDWSRVVRSGMIEVWTDPCAVIGRELSAAASSQLNELWERASQCQGPAAGQAPIVRGVCKMLRWTQWLQRMRYQNAPSE